MSDNVFKSECGCEIHLIKWSAKRKLLSVKNCSLHKAARDLLNACKAVRDDAAYGHSDEVKADTLRIIRRAIELAEARSDETGAEQERKS